MTLKPGRLLAIYAHPDDEAFGAAGTFAAFTDRGGEVTLVCATRGEAGQTTDPRLATPQRLGEARERELREAMAIVGVSDVRFLDYRDSGMRGSPDNDHPRAFMKADDGALVDALVAILREVEPDIVLTFGADGIYSHPDHVKAHVAATRAFETYKMQTGKQPALYYNAVPKERIETMSKRTVGPFVGMTSEELAQLGTPDELITTVIDVTGHYDRKLAAIAAHRTQIGPGGPWNDLPPETVRSYLTVERFSLVDGPGGDPLAEFVAATADEVRYGA